MTSALRYFGILGNCSRISFISTPFFSTCIIDDLALMHVLTMRNYMTVHMFLEFAMYKITYFERCKAISYKNRVVWCIDVMEVLKK